MSELRATKSEPKSDRLATAPFMMHWHRKDRSSLTFLMPVLSVVSPMILCGAERTETSTASKCSRSASRAAKRPLPLHTRCRCKTA